MYVFEKYPMTFGDLCNGCVYIVEMVSELLFHALHKSAIHRLAL